MFIALGLASQYKNIIRFQPYQHRHLWLLLLVLIFKSRAKISAHFQAS